jgi:hypothetical protein
MINNNCFALMFRFYLKLIVIFVFVVIPLWEWHSIVVKMWASQSRDHGFKSYFGHNCVLVQQYWLVPGSGLEQ